MEDCHNVIDLKTQAVRTNISLKGSLPEWRRLIEKYDIPVANASQSGKLNNGVKAVLFWSGCSIYTRTSFEPVFRAALEFKYR